MLPVTPPDGVWPPFLHRTLGIFYAAGANNKILCTTDGTVALMSCGLWPMAIHTPNSRNAVLLSTGIQRDDNRVIVPL